MPSSPSQGMSHSNRDPGPLIGFSEPQGFPGYSSVMEYRWSVLVIDERRDRVQDRSALFLQGGAECLVVGLLYALVDPDGPLNDFGGHSHSHTPAKPIINEPRGTC